MKLKTYLVHYTHNGEACTTTIEAPDVDTADAKLFSLRHTGWLYFDGIPVDDDRKYLILLLLLAFVAGLITAFATLLMVLS